MKICSNKDCKSKGKPLPLDKFYKREGMKDGRESRCIECRTEYDKARLHNKSNGNWLNVIIGGVRYE